MKGIETYEGKELDTLNRRKANLNTAIDDTERYIQDAKETITEKHEELDMLDLLIAKLKEREEEG